MVIVLVLVLVLVWTSFFLGRLVLRAEHVRVHDPAPAPPERAETPSGVSTATGGQDVLGWTALDDRQLTRLLTDSAP